MLCFTISNHKYKTLIMYHYLFTANCPFIQNDVYYLWWAPGVHGTL